jgi:hypothetical protein
MGAVEPDVNVQVRKMAQCHDRANYGGFHLGEFKTNSTIPLTIYIKYIQLQSLLVQRYMR